MKVAITADVHWNENQPERSEAFISILETLKNKEIKHLIIAGDLFDKAEEGYQKFDALLKNYKEIKIYIIPGNHDPKIISKHFIPPNIKVYSEPKVIEIEGRKIVFLPYRRNQGQTLTID